MADAVLMPRAWEYGLIVRELLPFPFLLIFFYNVFIEFSVNFVKKGDKHFVNPGLMLHNTTEKLMHGFDS